MLVKHGGCIVFYLVVMPITVSPAGPGETCAARVSTAPPGHCSGRAPHWVTLCSAIRHVTGVRAMQCAAVCAACHATTPARVTQLTQLFFTNNTLRMHVSLWVFVGEYRGAAASTPCSRHVKNKCKNTSNLRKSREPVKFKRNTKW